MMTRLLRALRTFAPLLLWASVDALARGGGGENYTTGRGGRDGGGDGGGGELVYWIIYLTIRHPQVMVPVLIVGGIGWWWYQKTHGPTPRTQRAFQQREAMYRTQVSPADVDAWVQTLKARDPAFELAGLLDRARRLFVELQLAWFRRDLTPVRPFLSDATYQRFNVQLALMFAQGIRDAISDVELLEAQLVGVDQTPFFDTVHLRIHARMRDTDVAATATDAEAETAARRVAPEEFTEVWSFVRRPGAQTKATGDLSQGRCPNCGAPFQGGAANSCEFCGAVVNSGNYDWVLAEITQGVEFVRHTRQIEGVAEARRADPGLNLEVLEDRASLVFWRWIDAQSRQEARRMAKVARPEQVAALDQELTRLREQGRRKVFLDCAVGGVNARRLGAGEDGFDRAEVEIRWSARLGVGPADSLPAGLPAMPQRWVFTLARKAGVVTVKDHGMATYRCTSCNAALTDSASPSCDYCGTVLNDGEHDWVLEAAAPFESWSAQRYERPHQPVRPPPPLRAAGARSTVPMDGADTVLDRGERERLLYMMAAMAAGDGEVDERERKLLKVCAERWSVAWVNVEMALRAGPALFDRLVQKGSPEAEVFLRNVVEMALVDGKIDRKERRMLEAAAHHLGVPDRLQGLLKR